MDINQRDKYILLGLNVAYYRKLAGFTQEKLADTLHVDATHISKVELAKVGASLDLIFNLADALEVTTHKLFEFRE